MGSSWGAGQPAAARYSGFTGMLLSGLFMTFSALFLLVFRDAVVGLYTKDAAVQAIAISMLLMAAVFQVADGVQIGAAGALRGYKDTRVPMFINTFSYWVLAFPLSYLAAVTFQAPPAYIWGGFVIGLTVAAFLLTARYHRVSQADA
ncbi:MAG: MATE family efflux transporter [Pseudomonadota bacterium]